MHRQPLPLRHHLLRLQLRQRWQGLQLLLWRLQLRLLLKQTVAV